MNSPKAVNPAKAMVRLFPQIVAALLSLSALGYFIGWREASAYYGALGAPWAVSMLPPFTLLQLSSDIAVFIGISAYVGFNNLATGHATAKRLGHSVGIILIIAFILYFANLVLSRWVPALVIYIVATAVAWAYATAAGLTVAELFGHLKLSEWRMSATHMPLIYFVVFLGLFQAPDQLGRARADWHLDPKATTLPIVNLPGAAADSKWRLVHIADGRALLISPAKERQNCTFRVIEAKDLPSIAAASSSAAK